MDGHGFDRIVRGLTAGGSRRQIVGSLVGGAAALLTGAAALEAKKGGNGKSRGKATGKGKNNKGGKGRPKVQFCHRNRKGQGSTLISVGGPAAKAHRKHGDELCTLDECNVAVTGCTDEGACEYEAASAETECTTEDGAAGFCDGEGTCVATSVEEG